MLNQDSHNCLVGEPDVEGYQSAVGDLPPQHFDVLRHASREQVTVFRVAVKPL